MDIFLKLFFDFHQDFFLCTLVVIRLYGAMAAMPMFADSFVGKVVKMNMCFAFALVIFPSIQRDVLHNPSFFLQVFYAIKEYVLGYFCGFLLAVPVWMMESVGNLIDNQRGEQMGAVLSKLTSNPDSSVGKLIMQAFIVYFLQINGMVVFLHFMYQTFFLYPLDSIYPFFDVRHTELYIQIFKNFFMWVFVVASPIVVVMFLVEIVLGLMSSFLPSLNVTILSMPIKSAVGIFVLVVYFNILLHVVLHRGLAHVQWFLHPVTYEQTEPQKRSHGGA